MATLAEIEAAIAKAEAAGRKDLADQLRVYAEQMRIEEAIAKAEAKGRTDLADQLRTYLPQQPEPPAETPPNGIDAATGLPMAMLPPMYDPAAAGSTPRQPDTFGETAAKMVEGPMSAARAFGGGLVGGPSPSREYLASDPIVGNLPGFALTGLGAIGDLGGAALSTLGAGVAGLTGLAVEAVPGQNSQDERKLAEDLTGMTMFAVPELAGASSVAGRMAASAPKVAKAAPDVPQATPTTPPVSAPVASAVKTATPEEIGALANKAASGGMGSVKAQEELAKMARVNPEAKAAADRLGIELPVDVFFDDEAARAAVGLTRSEVGKEPEALWRQAVKSARDKADEVMAALDGSPDIASVSEAVKSSLQATQAGLKQSAKKLYEMVDAKVPKGTPANVSNIVKSLNEVIQEIGGVKGMTGAEKALFELVTGDQVVTYGRLIREKNLIGKAIARGESPYSSLDSATLARMYAAISEDQLATVAAIGDGTLRATLREANQLTAKQKGLEKRIIAAFGSDLDGSIGQRLKSAVKTASQGDIAGLVRILKVIPEDLRKSATASAISAATRSARATEPGFGLSEFSKVFGGIMTNKPVYNLIGKTIGPEAMGMLKDLHTVAQRIAVADSNVLRTGKANQALVGAMTAEGLIGRALHSTAGQRIASATAMGAASATGGPVGAVLAGALAPTMLKASPDMLAKVGKMFASAEFQNLAIEAATKAAANPATVEALKKSPAFKAWASSLADGPRTDFLKSLAAPVAGQAANTPPDYEALWGRYGK